MKKITLLFVLFGAFSAMSKAQIVPDIISPGTTWKILTVATDQEMEGSVSYYGELLLTNDRYANIGDEGYIILKSGEDEKAALGFAYTPDQIRIIFKTEDGFDRKNEILLYDFTAFEGDTIVHGPVYKHFPVMAPDGFIREAAEKFGDCFSVVRKLDYSRKKNDWAIKTIIVDCYATYTEPSTGKKDTLYLGEDAWMDGIGSIYGFYASWAGLGPNITGPGWVYSYYLMSFTADRWYYNNPDHPDPDYPDPNDPRSLDQVGASGLSLSYNESSKDLTVSSDNTDPAVFQLIDLSGRLISQVPFSGDATFSLRGYAEGIYLFKIIRSNESVYSSKIKL